MEGGAATYRLDSLLKCQLVLTAEDSMGPDVVYHLRDAGHVPIHARIDNKRLR